MNISEVESIDGGAYTCKAINSVGTVSHTARVNVYGKHVSISIFQDLILSSLNVISDTNN